MKDPTNKTYLGDGAYVAIGSYVGEVVLTAEDGVRETNRVVLDPYATAQLLRWLKQTHEPTLRSGNEE